MADLENFKIALDEHAIVAVTDRRGKISYVNDKFCAISQYSSDELLGKDHRIINSGYHTKDFFKNLWGTIKSGNTWKGEIRNRAKDGSIYWVNTTIVPILGQGGEPIQYIAIRAEITNLKLLEERNIEVIKELEETNKELSDFAYVVSHDLKAPLRGIHSLTNWLIEDYADKLDADGAQQLGLIANRVTRLNKLVDGILAYSRAGRNREDRQVVDLESLVHNVIELLAAPSHISVEVVAPLPQVMIEAFKAQQLFQNLLANAVKFMDKPVGKVVVDCVKEGALWHFTIKDNGPGIDTKYFNKIFELFQTLSRRDEVEGAGVGLSLVRKIIELEGGTIWVESTVGVGTAFNFTLPCIVVD